MEEAAAEAVEAEEIKGKLVGADISQDMISQFKKKCANFSNAKIIYARIDQSLPFEEEFDKVFISFLLHGFLQAIREVITDNAYKALKRDGEFYILDWNVLMPLILLGGIGNRYWQIIILMALRSIFSSKTI